MIVDRDGGLSPGELRGEKAVGRVGTPLRRMGLAIFKEADGERHVAHRRRPHEHAPQVDPRNAKGHSLVSFEKVAEEVHRGRPGAGTVDRWCACAGESKFSTQDL